MTVFGKKTGLNNNFRIKKLPYQLEKFITNTFCLLCFFVKPRSFLIIKLLKKKKCKKKKPICLNNHEQRKNFFVLDSLWLYMIIKHTCVKFDPGSGKKQTKMLTRLGYTSASTMIVQSPLCVCSDFSSPASSVKKWRGCHVQAFFTSPFFSFSTTQPPHFRRTHSRFPSIRLSKDQMFKY